MERDLYAVTIIARANPLRSASTVTDPMT